MFSSLYCCSLWLPSPESSIFTSLLDLTFEQKIICFQPKRKDEIHEFLLNFLLLLVLELITGLVIKRFWRQDITRVLVFVFDEKGKFLYFNDHKILWYFGDARQVYFLRIMNNNNKEGKSMQYAQVEGEWQGLAIRWSLQPNAASTEYSWCQCLPASFPKEDLIPVIESLVQLPSQWCTRLLLQ